MILHWRHRESGRYYTVSLERNLFGEYTLTLAWGREGSRGGKIRHLPVASEKEGLLAMGRISARREGHGYELVEVEFPR